MFYLHHRRSYDLDLFTPEEVSPKEIQNLVLRVTQEIGAETEQLRTAPDFHRFLITRNDEREILDIVTDRAPQLDPDKKIIDGIRVDTAREMLANKLTTLLSHPFLQRQTLRFKLLPGPGQVLPFVRQFLEKRQGD